MKKGDKKYYDQLNPTQKIESDANKQKQFRVQHSDKYPHRTICFIKMKLKTQNHQQPSVMGTGCLVSNKFLLTASHNLVGKKKQMDKLTNLKASFKDKSYIMQGLGLGQKEEKQDQEQEQIKRYICRLKIVKQMIHPEYIKHIDNPDKSQTMDYALIQIDPKSPGLKEDKFMPIVYLSGDSINELKPQISIYGYPVKYNKQKSHNKGQSSLFMNYQCGDSNKLEKYQKKYLSYNIMTQPGSSGAPIIGEFRGEHIILGIHIRGDQRHQQSSRGVSAAQMLQYLNEKGYQLQKRPFVYTDKTFSLHDKDISDRQILFLMDRHFQPCDMWVFTAFDLKNVQKIILSGNLLGNQGVQILLRRQYPKLTGLFLTQNSINDLSNKSIKWDNIKNVKTLGLNVNQLSTLPQGIKVLKNIEKFWLAHNYFKTMPDLLHQFCIENNRESLSVYLYENKMILESQKIRIAQYKQNNFKFKVIWSREGQQKQLKMP